MRITVRLLGQARQLAGTESVETDLPDEACAHEALPAVLDGADSRLVALLSDDHGKLRRCVMAVLHDKVIDPGETGLLKDGDTLDLLPPMSGG